MRTRIRLQQTLSLICIMMGLPAVANGQNVLFGNIPDACCDGRFVANAASIRPSNNQDRMAQPFMTGTTGAVSIRLPLAMLGSPSGMARFEIWDDEGGKPSQMVTIVGNVDLTTLAPAPNGEIVAFDQAISGLEPNSIHYLMLILSEATLPNNNNTLRLLVTDSSEGINGAGNLLVLVNGSWRSLKSLLGPITSFLQMEVKELPLENPDIFFGNIPDDCCDGRFVADAASIRPTNSEDRLAQPFMTGDSEAISIRLPLAMLGSPTGIARFEIWDDDEGKPNQRIGEAARVDLAQLEPTPNGEIIVFDQPVSDLKPNALHYLLLILSEATLPDNNNTLRLLVTESSEGTNDAGNLLALVNGSWLPLKQLLGPVTSYLQMEVRRAPVTEFIVALTEDGTVTRQPDMKTYPIGSDVTVTAAPEEGFEFVKWTYGDEEITTNPATITIQEGATLTPYFSEVEEPKPLHIDIKHAVVVSWDSQTDRVYQIHSSTDMESWEIAVDRIEGTGERFTQCFIREETEVFYRVEETP